MPDVRMPDGTILRGVPANASRAQIMETYQRARQAGAVKDSRPTSFWRGTTNEVARAGANAQQAMEYLNPLLMLPGLIFQGKRGSTVSREQNDSRERTAPTQGSTAGRITGAVIGAAPTMLAPQANIARGASLGARALNTAANIAIQGGGSGYLNTANPNNVRQTAKDVALGMAGDAVGRGVGSAAARTIGGKMVPKNVRLLANEGVVMTPGMRAGKRSIRNTVEDKVLGSIPLVSDVVDSARQRGQNDLRRAVANRVIAPIDGGKVPRGTQINNEFISQLQDKVYSNLDDAAGNMRLWLDDGLVEGLAAIERDAPRLLGSDGSAQLGANINYLADRLSGGELSGPALRETLGEIRKVASSDKGQLGQQLWQVHDQIVGALERQNAGGSYQQFAKAREAATLLKRMEDAASRPGVTNGEFGPSQLMQAVQRRGFGTSTGNLASGEARMFDLANAAKDVMGNATANSGTIPRAIAGGGLLGGAAGGAAMIDPTMGALTAGSLAGYIPGVDRAVQAIALNRPDAMMTAAEIVRRNNRAFGLLGAGGALGLFGQ